MVQWKATIIILTNLVYLISLMVHTYIQLQSFLDSADEELSSYMGLVVI